MLQHIKFALGAVVLSTAFAVPAMADDLKNPTVGATGQVQAAPKAHIDVTDEGLTVRSTADATVKAEAEADADKAELREEISETHQDLHEERVELQKDINEETRDSLERQAAREQDGSGVTGNVNSSVEFEKDKNTY